jgi:predicted TIM-barrel fold metal-dependent hydrolase
VDLDDPAAGAEIERLAAHPGVLGVRFFGMTERRHWIGTKAASTAFAVAARLGLTVVVTVPGELLAQIARPILEADTLVALDHCGFPNYQRGVIAEHDAVWAFASAEHVALKVTTHSFQHAAVGVGQRHGERLLTGLADRFGTSRLMWGSDFPQSSRTSYSALVAQGRDAATHLDDAERAAFLGANAMRFFRLH